MKQQSKMLNVGVPRVIALSAHNAIGVSALNVLAVVGFARGMTWPVKVLPGIADIGLTLEREAIDAAVATVSALQSK